MANATGPMQNVTVRLFPNDKGNPPGKLADAELYFADGALAGLKLSASPSGSARTAGAS